MGSHVPPPDRQHLRATQRAKEAKGGGDYIFDLLNYL